MSIWRKRPVKVRAAQIQAIEGDNAAFNLGDGDSGEWLHNALQRPVGEPGAVWVLNDGVRIGTLEGTMQAEAGDWLVQGTSGELYSVKGSIFPDIYEEADDP